MIELLNNQLTFSFPEVHKEASCNIHFQRTLRIPDDNNEYPLPPGLGNFPLEHVDDYAENLPENWRTHGGVFLPMYQSEAMWISFSGTFPCAVKVAAGKIDAVSGEVWNQKLTPKPQDYLVRPDQPWLDGFNVSEGYIRQFVAMPLGEGFSAEEQITGKAEHGGLQIIVYPMKKDAYEEYCRKRDTIINSRMCCSMDPGSDLGMLSEPAPDMGLAPGGLMKQKIYEDEYGIDVWDQDNGSRCFIHLTNSLQYQKITGHNPPHKPATARQYTNAGLPWFDYYADGKAVEGSGILSKLTSVAAKTIEQGKGTLPDNESLQPKTVKIIRKDNQVRNGEF